MLTGRYEHEMELELKAKAGLEGFPMILFYFYDLSAGSQKTTKTNNLNHVKRFVTWLKDEKGLNIYDEGCWQKITTFDIQQYFIHIKVRTLKDGTLKYMQLDSALVVFAGLNKFFEFLRKQKIIAENPMFDRADLSDIIPEDNGDKEVVYMEYDEVDAVVDSIRSTSRHPLRDECIFMLGCTTGLRAQALSEIDVDDFWYDKKERRWKLKVIEKGRKKRDIKLDAYMMELVNRYKAQRGDYQIPAFFLRAVGDKQERITKKTIERMIERHTKGLDKHITPHKMRSTCITNTYNETGDIYDASRRAGHNSIAVTTRYINTDKRDGEVADTMGGRFFHRNREAQEQQ